MGITDVSPRLCHVRRLHHGGKLDIIKPFRGPRLRSGDNNLVPYMTALAVVGAGPKISHYNTLESVQNLLG